MDELNKALAKITELSAERDAANKRADAEKTRADQSDAKAKELELSLTKSESEKAAEKTRADAEKTRADTAEKARKDADDAFEAKVQERANLQAQAIEYLGRNDKGEVLAVDGKSTVDVQKMDARALKCVIVEKLDGTKIDEKRSDDAVAYAHELAVARASKSAAAMGAARTVITAGRADATSGSDEAKNAAASKARLSNAWKADKADKEGK